MDNLSQQKVIKQGFTILRKAESIKIEKKESGLDQWGTFATFETEESRDNAFDRFMALDYVINDG